MAEPRESEMAGFVDHFAAEGNWAMAISIARMVLREYEAGDPRAYAPLVNGPWHASTS